MAGTRGLAQFRGKQLNDKIMRNRHFDEDNKIHERYIDITWESHREILEDTKIDVFVQANGLEVSGLNSVDVTEAVGGRPISTGEGVEGIVLGEKVELRRAGTDDFPKIDGDGDKVYGRIRHDETEDKFYLDFYSPEGGVETPYTFPAEAEAVDYRFIVRTNLSIIPVDAIVKNGSGFVEGATDAKAYMNLNQLMKDLYGAIGELNGDGNAILGESVLDQLLQEVQDRIDADQAIRDDLASNDEGEGASLVGVIADPNYDGLTVQAALTDLAQRLVDREQEFTDARSRDEDTANEYFQAGTFDDIEGRFKDIEDTADAVFQDHEDRLTELETEEEEEVYEAVGGETTYMLVNGKAKPKSVLLFINGQVQAPGINFEYILDGEGLIEGFNFAPDTLEVHEGRPDVLYVKYKKVFLV